MANLGGPPEVPGFLRLEQPQAEGFKGKFSRKMQENPFVPIGCLATAGALTYGLLAFRQGKTRVSQLSMRARIVAQGFTVVAILGGVIVAAMKPRT